MLRRYLHDWRLEQLPIPAQTLTTDLVSATQVVRETGDAVDSILESINLPVLSAPLCKDGMTLVDGGVLNNLPADVLVRKNCSFVIGVDVTSSIEKEFAGNSAETPTEQMKIPGAVATLIRCMNVQAHNLSSIGAASADLVINPDVSGFDSADFTKTPELAEIGQRATDDLIPEIRAMLKRIDGDLF
jgi:predicted acylesterase/phospholipase RssA